MEKEKEKQNSKLYNKYVGKYKKKKQIFLNKLNNIQKLNFQDIDLKESLDERKNLHDVIKYDKINSNYFTGKELLQQQVENDYEKTIHYILVVISFILMWLCGQYGLFLIFETILLLFYPYVYIPLKILLCHKYMLRNCKFIYKVFNLKLNNNFNLFI